MNKNCENCKYEHIMPESIPCCYCSDSNNFEPKTKLEETLKSEYKMGQAIPCSAEELKGAAKIKSATEAVAEVMHYSHPLYEAYDDAVAQATKGKGVRHGGDTIPFLEQPIMQIAKHTGVGGLIFQMVKKAQEACGKDDQEAFERELLGALVYGGAAYLYVKQHGFKK